MPYENSAVSDMLKFSQADAAKCADQSPSASPLRAPLHQPFNSNQTLPVRETVAGILETDRVQPIPETSSSERSASPEALRLTDTGPRHHYLLLPMVSMVRGVYTSRINAARSDIENYVKNTSNDADITKKIDFLLDDLARLCDHRDTEDITTTTISTASTAQDALHTCVSEAKWAENCSTKCLFVTELLRSVRHLDIHIAILVRPGRMVDVIEAIVRAEHIIYERADRQVMFKDNSMEGLHITIMASNSEHGEFGTRQPDVIIALDPLFARNRHELRGKSLTSPSDIVMISLVIIHSVEHLELCLPTYANATLAKRQLVYCVAQLRKTVGILDNDLAQPDEAAMAISQYLMEDPLGGWPLSGGGDITGLDMIGFQPQSLPESTAQFQEILPARRSASQLPKRAYSDDYDKDPAKRIKTMAPSWKTMTSANATTRTTRSTQYQPGNDQVEILLRKTSQMETEMRNHILKESELQALVNTLEARLADHIASIQRIAPKYQEALNERAALQVERDTAMSRADAATARLEVCLQDTTKLKDDKARLSEELRTQRSASHLEGADNPSLVTQIVALQADKDRLEKKAASMAQDFAYTRESYQKASSSSVEFASELAEAQEQIVLLQRRASENLVRIHETQAANERREREARIDELEVMLAARDADLARLGQELKAKTNGRRETRASSVPRSPRLGSIGVMAGAMSPRARGSSRQGSPAPGDLTNMRQNQFSDVLLYPSGLGSASRLGHLREGT